MNLPLDKSYITPTRVDEAGKIVNWDPEREAECLEYGLPKYTLPKMVGAAGVGLKWLWPGRIPQGRVTVEYDLKTSPDTRLVVIDSLKTFAPTPKLMRESLAMLDKGKQHGYSESMLWRAKTELGITSRCKNGTEHDGRWLWTMPGQSSEDPDLKTDLGHDQPGVGKTLDAIPGADNNATSQASAPAPEATPVVTLEHTGEMTGETNPEPAREKFSKCEFLAENGGKQPVSAEPSEARGANKNAPDRQPAPAATSPNAPWTLNSQKACEPSGSLATESRPPVTSTDYGQR